MQSRSPTDNSQLPDQNPAFKSLMRFYDAEARYSKSGSSDDRSALLETLHRDIVLRQPESLPYGGEFRGREAFGLWLDAFTNVWADITPINPKFHLAGESLLISTVTMSARARKTDTEIAMPMCQIIRFSEGLPIEWRNFAWDTVQMCKALDYSPR